MPLEKSFPKERIDYMLKASNCCLVLGSGSDTLDCDVEYVDITRQAGVLDTALALPFEPPVVQVDQLSNVMFTSGSTGKPKGVMLTHRGMVNLCVPETTYWTEQLRSGLTTGISFDPSGFEIFATLLGGSELHILPDSGVFDANEFKQFILSSRENFIFSLLQSLTEASKVCNEYRALPVFSLRSSKMGLRGCRKVISSM